MSQLIVTSRYLKSGNQKNKTKRRNYTKYIATRETVEIRSQKFVDRNAAKRVNKRNETIYNKKAEVLCGKSCADPPLSRLGSCVISQTHRGLRISHFTRKIPFVIMQVQTKAKGVFELCITALSR